MQRSKEALYTFLFRTIKNELIVLLLLFIKRIILHNWQLLLPAHWNQKATVKCMTWSSFTVKNNIKGFHPLDGHHSTAPRFNVFHIGGRYVGTPEWLHDVIWNYLSQNTCGTKTQQLLIDGGRSDTATKEQFAHLNFSFSLCEIPNIQAQKCI